MYFAVDEENCRKPARLQRKEKNRTRRKLLKVVLFIGATLSSK